MSATSSRSFRKQLGSMIRHIRRLHKWTRQDVAELVCMSPVSVEKWEQGVKLPRSGSFGRFVSVATMTPHRLRDKTRLVYLAARLESSGKLGQLIADVEHTTGHAFQTTVPA